MGGGAGGYLGEEHSRRQYKNCAAGLCLACSRKYKEVREAWGMGRGDEVGLGGDVWGEGGVRVVGDQA